ncbi:MAG TPA: class I SAM-dependent methyltransferase [Gemmatimonadaceae bacterium]|nr:class I SAM-dependent methyltransferase [Gemmatimonadaceae bacterium]
MTSPSTSLAHGAAGANRRSVRVLALATDPVVRRNRATWVAGDFERIAAGYRSGADDFVGRLGITRGERVLDVACGSGNLTLPAARRGAVTVGVDIAPNLLDIARGRAADEGLAISFDEGNAEALPYDDGAFDTVITMFGAMFAPRPQLAAAELLRVVRPAGRIAMANWTPASFVGAMLKAHVAMVPPPAGIPSTLLWGDEATARERLAESRSLSLTRRSIYLEFPVSPADVVQLFRDYYGPTVRTFEALDDRGRAKLFADLVSLWSDANEATDGTTRVASEYLEVVAER